MLAHVQSVLAHVQSVLAHVQSVLSCMESVLSCVQSVLKRASVLTCLQTCYQDMFWCMHTVTCLWDCFWIATPSSPRVCKAPKHTMLWHCSMYVWHASELASANIYNGHNLRFLSLSTIIFATLINHLGRIYLLSYQSPTTMPYQQFNTIFTSNPIFPLVHSQCSINDTNMDSPLHTICLDEGMENSYIHAYYADHYLPDLIWTECKCPLSGNNTHYANVTMTFQTTGNTLITLDVCLYRGSINTGNKSLWAPMTSIGTMSLSITMIFWWTSILLWNLWSWSKGRIQVCTASESIFNCSV